MPPFPVVRNGVPRLLSCKSPSSDHLERRHEFKQLLLNPSRSNCPRPKEDDASIFARLDDDVLAKIFTLVYLDQTRAHAVRLHAARILLTFTEVCQRFRRVFETICNKLRVEVAARRTTRICPLTDGPFSYTAQLEAETGSSRQLWELCRLFKDEPLHCASDNCVCAEERSADVVSVLRQADVHAVTRDGSVLFANTKRRLSPREWDHSIVCVKNNKVTDTYAHKHTNESDPLYISVHPEGKAVAFITERYDDQLLDPRLSVLHVWEPGSAAEERKFPFRNHNHPCAACVNAQCIWWTRDGAGHDVLSVLWATTFVHPTGQLIGQSTNSGLWAVEWTTFQNNRVMFTPFNNAEEALPVPYGAPQSVSASDDGHDFVVLVRLDEPGPTVPKRVAVHASLRSLGLLGRRYTALDPSAVWRLDRRAEADPIGGPNGAAITPAGDAIVCTHRTHGSVIVEVLVRSENEKRLPFVSVQTIDVTHLLSLGVQDRTVFDDPGSLPGHSLRLPYAFVFSPCGRFVALVDQRPHWGLPPLRHNVVVLDMAMRHRRNGLRAIPLVPRYDMFVCSLAWTTSSFFLRPQHGLLQLCV
tara:strand:- start:1107 stop:2861 length:1755 start_codon:yes stop_codon:yes gene_type:complete